MRRPTATRCCSARRYLSINPALYPTSGYNPFTDLAPISRCSRSFPNVMMVSNSSPAHSVREFIDYAKANRGSVTFASTGIGASPHLSGELFKRMAGIEMTHVPYRGAGPAMNDLVPGRVSVMFSNLPGVMPQIQGKTVRGLGITSRQAHRGGAGHPDHRRDGAGLRGGDLVGRVRSGRGRRPM